MKTTPSSSAAHLSAAQISAWIQGERSSEAKQHLAACNSCQADIDRFENALDGFRDSARAWSGNALRRQPCIAPAKHNRRGTLIIISSCGAAALLLIAVLAQPPRRVSNDEPMAYGAAGRVEPTTHSSAVDETSLAAQIDLATSRTVPAAMDSLSRLVAGDEARVLFSGREAKI